MCVLFRTLWLLRVLSVSPLGRRLVCKTELVGEYLDRRLPFDPSCDVTEVGVRASGAPSVVDSMPSCTTLLLEEQVLQWSGREE